MHPLISNAVIWTAGTHMSEMQQQVLRSALARAQKEVRAEVGATWCDSLPCLLAMEWPRARQHLLAPQPQSTSVVVQAWMQVGTLHFCGHGRPTLRCLWLAAIVLDWLTAAGAVRLVPRRTWQEQDVWSCSVDCILKEKDAAFRVTQAVMLCNRRLATSARLRRKGGPWQRCRT